MMNLNYDSQELLEPEQDNIPQKLQSNYNTKDFHNTQSDQIRDQLFSWIASLQQSYSEYISDLSDFQNGIILCDLIDLIIYDRENNELISQIVFDEKMSYENCIFNLNIALQSMKEGILTPDRVISSLTAETLFHVNYINIDVYKNEENIIQVLLYLRQMHVKKQTETIKQSLNNTPNKIHKNSINNFISPEFKQTPSQSHSKKPPLIPINNTSVTKQNNQSSMDNLFIQTMPQPSVKIMKPNSPFGKTAGQLNFCPSMPSMNQQENKQNNNQLSQEKKQQKQQIKSKSLKKNLSAKKIVQNPLHEIKPVTPDQNTISPINFDQTPRYSQIFYKDDQYSMNSRGQTPKNERLQQLENEISQLDQKIHQESFDYKENKNKKSVSPMNKSHSRSLSKSKRNVNITPVTNQQIEHGLQWLGSINLIKTNLPNIKEKLPKICKNGVIFYDLIQRMEGKDNCLKGIQRQPKNNSQINANYNKIMDFLQQKPKMNPRYLWAQTELAQGNIDVFWGFLDDIRYLYQNKQSPYDERNDKQVITRPTASVSILNKSLTQEDSYQPEEQYDNLYQNSQKLPYQKPHQDLKKKQVSKEKVQKNSAQDNLKKTEEPPQQKTNSYSQLHRTKKYLYQQTDRINNHKQQQQQTVRNSVSHQQYKQEISFEIQQSIQQWMRDIGLGAYININDVSLFEDPYRNGRIFQIICEKIELIPKKKPAKIENMEKCRANLRNIMNFLENNYQTLEIPPYVFQEEMILKGDHDIIWGVIYYLMKAYKNNLVDKIDKQDYQENTTINAILPIQQIQNINLPYNQSQLEELEHSLLKFLKIFQLIDVSIQSFSEIGEYFQEGVLLCQCVNSIINMPCQAMYNTPSNSIQKKANVNRALNALKKVKTFGQKFNWKQKEIQDGNYYVILGLLEDMHRFYDGLPARTGANYFIDGPYFGSIEFWGTKGQGNLAPDWVINGILKNDTRHSLQQIPLKQSDQEPDYLQDSYQECQKQKPFSLLDGNYERSCQLIENINQRNKELLYKKTQQQTIAKKIAGDQQLALKNYEDVTERNKKNYSVQQSSKYEAVIQWLGQLGFKDFVHRIDFGRPYLEEFKDGLFYCKLVELLELTQISGVNLKPKTTASCVVNIRKVLSILKNKPELKLKYFEDEEILQESQNEMVLQFLEDIRNAYKNQTKNLLKTNYSLPKKKEETLSQYGLINEKKSYILSHDQRQSSIVQNSPYR